MLAAVVVLAPVLSCSGSSESAGPCEDRELNLAFYAHFPPVSHSADRDPSAAGFDTHLGYEADLLEAVEALGEGLTFNRTGIDVWEGVWLKPAEPGFDMAGGGITVLDVRTRDAEGNTAVAFTSGHITFRQSLLVRAEDAASLAEFSDLTESVTAGVTRSTTGEFRLLQLTGIADAAGVLESGTRVHTPDGMVTADGSSDFAITPGSASAGLAGRTRLEPASPQRPVIVYLGDDGGDAEISEALRAGGIDVTAGDAVGNLHTASQSAGALVVTALDPLNETGGFSVAAADSDLRLCLNERINFLTDGGNIGVQQWLDDPEVFNRRAQTW